MATSSNNSNNSILQALNVKVIGAGDRGFLVFAHGLGTDQSIWQRILPFFIRHYRIVLFDLVCAGSVNPELFDFRRYSVLDSYADDLLSIVDALGVERCAYVGHSISAMIGILASVRRPELFSRLILIGASPKFQNDGDYHGGFDREVMDVVFAAMESNYVAWVNGFAPLAVGADVPEAVREFSRTLFNMRPDISLFTAKMAFEIDMRGVLGSVKTPCYIIQTARDMAVPASVAAYMQSHLGGPAKLEMINTEGHLPHLTATLQVVRAIQRSLGLN